MHKLFSVKAYEAENGPHFDEECARKAVSKMENEDGSRGQHYTLEEAYRLATQYGVPLTNKVNKYDWYVALNMVYSDYYRAILNICGSVNTKHFVEFAKAWLMDKDADEGKMWHYYVYIMKDDIREEEMEAYEACEEELEEYSSAKHRRGMGRRRMTDEYNDHTYPRSMYDGYRKKYEDDYDDDEYEPRHRRTRSVRYMRY